MKKYISFFIIVVIILLFIPLIWIEIKYFDKYKFTEEYYKFIVYSVQLVLFGAVFSVVLNKVLDNNHNRKKQKLIEGYLQEQEDNIYKIKNCLTNEEKNGLVETLRKFKVTSVLLGDIDRTEKAQLEKLDYWDKVKDEITFIIDNIETKKISDMKQASSVITHFLDNYLKDRNDLLT